MATLVKSFAIQGIDAYPVDIETKTMEGQPKGAHTRCQARETVYKYSLTFS